MDEYQMEFATGFGESYHNCPACGKEMVAGNSECFSCGVIVNKFETRKSTNSTINSIGGIDHLTETDLKRLDRKWKLVVVNYNDQRGHQEFISLCQEVGAIPFAVHHYTQMLEIDREDDIAHLMRRQSLSRLTVQFEIAKTPVKGLSKEKAFFGLDFYLKWINWIGLFIGSFFVVAGQILPDSKNLVGLGVASLALFVALHIYRRR